MTQRPSVSGHLRTDAAPAGRRQQKGLLNDAFAFPLLDVGMVGDGNRKVGTRLSLGCSSHQGLARGRYASEAGQLEKARLRSEQQIYPHSAVCTQYTALDTRTYARTHSIYSVAQQHKLPRYVYVAASPFRSLFVVVSMLVASHLPPLCGAGALLLA
jgi:hypothetical protein